jgi:O-antigen ligase
MAFATVLASFFTFTRTSLIACLLATMVFAFALRYVSKTRATKALAVMAVVFVIAAVLFVYRNMTSTTRGNQVSARWSEVEKGSIGSGRLEVFYAAWTRFATASKLRQFVGHGIGAGPEAAEEFMGVYVYLHDDFLEMLVCGGLIGLALYLRFFWRLYRDVLDGLIRRNVWAVAALASMAVYSLTSISYMRIYAVTPNTYFALAAGTSLGMLHVAPKTLDQAGAQHQQI